MKFITTKITRINQLKLHAAIETIFSVLVLNKRQTVIMFIFTTRILELVNLFLRPCGAPLVAGPDATALLACALSRPCTYIHQEVKGQLYQFCILDFYFDP